MEKKKDVGEDVKELNLLKNKKNRSKYQEI